MSSSAYLPDLQHPLALHIGIKYGSGGEGRVFSELSKYMPSAGIDLIGVVGGPDDVSQFTQGKVVNFALDGAGMANRLMGARKVIGQILKQSRPDIVGSHFALYTAPALDLMKGLPKVTHFHGPWADESKQEGSSSGAAFAKAQVENYVYRNSDRVIVLSKAFAELVTDRYSVNPEVIRIVPGSVDIQRFSLADTRQDARLHLGLPTDRPILLSVRRLVQRMGLSNLIEAVAAISKVIPDVLLCIGGEGGLRSSLERQVREHNLTKYVRFLGYIDEASLPRLYRAADINVVPTLALEGFGLVAAEALAAGTPSMVTPIGGLPEVVASLSENLIFRSSSVEDLADGLIAGLLGKVKLPSQSNCESYARENYNSTLMAERTVAVYRELL
ncbi:glycosyltransferase family 4 protein [Granulicella tundricola]|uniref:Glycosyl transferase group 1 n=1 Tax=Granulicella tundricola (strain ATCC BAA-1859 / DSM 23138 / MP5ACTX9) TaxID=1198114 RepID=E8X7R8_GRATM|nr:glycosyltransferase family 4 protein [Granulicella tundricola]ADW71502.1 glycosyl transferase group 1 [Granulicella tundricola MP5ACTX9]